MQAMQIGKKKDRVGKRSLTAPRSFSFSFPSFAFVRGKSSVGRQLAQGERKEKRTQVDTSGPHHFLESTHQFPTGKSLNMSKAFFYHGLADKEDMQ